MKPLITTLATLFGLGYMPAMPGTIGSLGAALAYWYLLPETPQLYFTLLFVTCVAGVAIAHRAEKIFAIHDDPRIVIDEVAGLWLALFLLPKTFGFMVAAFALFRFFDIKKPMYIRKIQNLPGGFGIMADDILAGLYANLVLRLILFIFHRAI